MDYIFTNNWFCINKSLFEKVLTKYKDEPVKILEIGAYEGRSTMWLIDNIMNHPDSTLDVVDPFLTNDPTSPVENKTLDLFLNNLSKSKHPLKVKLHQDLSENVYFSLENQYDIAYIDGCHMPWNIVHDLVNVWYKMKLGGNVICDDYGSSNTFGTKYSPSSAMNFFLSTCLKGQGYEIHNIGWALHIIKTEDQTFSPDEFTIDYWKTKMV